MYEKLLAQLSARPALYAPSSAPFWDDAHISKGMLKAHLNESVDSASRNRAFIEASARWIARIADGGTKKTLLDLGCGPGLYATQFAEHGFTVTGIDFSRRSIEYAQRAAAKSGQAITYRYQNYLEIAYESEFDVVTLIYCDFGVLSPSDRQCLLGKIYRALKPGGCFIVDAFTARYFADFTQSQRIEYQDQGYWSCEPYVCLQQNIRYDEEHTFLEQYHVITANAIERYAIWNHAFEKNEMINLLRSHGFSEVDVYGDVAGAELTTDSPTLCAVGRKS